MQVSSIIGGLILFLTFTIQAVELDGRLLDAIELVESGGRFDAVGDGGMSIGAYQLTKAYVRDVNRIYGTAYTARDRMNKRRSREMTYAYLLYYGRVYERRTGKIATYEVLSRIHNGGPYGMYKQSTNHYWRKVEEVLRCRQ